MNMKTLRALPWPSRRWLFCALASGAAVAVLLPALAQTPTPTPTPAISVTRYSLSQYVPVVAFDSTSRLWAKPNNPAIIMLDTTGPTLTTWTHSNSSVFGTGFGQASPNTPAGQVVPAPAPLANVVKIQIDTVLADVRYAGLTSAGLYQFDITIPDLPDGDHAVTAQAGSARTRRIGTIRIQRQTAGAAIALGSRRHALSR